LCIPNKSPTLRQLRPYGLGRFAPKAGVSAGDVGRSPTCVEGSVSGNVSEKLRVGIDEMRD
jgi:hypothetical protein